MCQAGSLQEPSRKSGIVKRPKIVRNLPQGDLGIEFISCGYLELHQELTCSSLLGISKEKSKESDEPFLAHPADSWKISNAPSNTTWAALCCAPLFSNNDIETEDTRKTEWGMKQQALEVKFQTEKKLVTSLPSGKQQPTFGKVMLQMLCGQNPAKGKHKWFCKLINVAKIRSGRVNLLVTIIRCRRYL